MTCVCIATQHSNVGVDVVTGSVLSLFVKLSLCPQAGTRPELCSCVFDCFFILGESSRSEALLLVFLVLQISGTLSLGSYGVR